MNTVVQLNPRSPTLDELAHEINVRLQKADDHRLSASLKLAEAHAECAKQGVAFKTWVSANIVGLGYVEATKLAKIGAAPDPAKALAANRTATRERVAKIRSAAVAYVRNSDQPTRPKQGKAAAMARVLEAMATLSGLPAPDEVLGYFAGTDEAVLVSERLPTAARWLAEFAEIWPEEAVDAH